MSTVIDEDGRIWQDTPGKVARRLGTAPAPLRESMNLVVVCAATPASVKRALGGSVVEGIYQALAPTDRGRITGFGLRYTDNAARAHAAVRLAGYAGATVTAHLVRPYRGTWVLAAYDAIRSRREPGPAGAQ